MTILLIKEKKSEHNFGSLSVLYKNQKFNFTINLTVEIKEFALTLICSSKRKCFCLLEISAVYFIMQRSRKLSKYSCMKAKLVIFSDNKTRCLLLKFLVVAFKNIWHLID